MLSKLVIGLALAATLVLGQAVVPSSSPVAPAPAQAISGCVPFDYTLSEGWTTSTGYRYYSDYRYSVTRYYNGTSRYYYAYRYLKKQKWAYGGWRTYAYRSVRYSCRAWSPVGA